MKVKITSKLPEGTANGLVTLWRHLIDQPSDAVVVVAILDTKQLTTEIDDGEVTPTARILSIEPIGGPDSKEARRLLRRAYEKRTGENTLPLDLEKAIDSIGDFVVDPDTGEVRDPDGDEK